MTYPRNQDPIDEAERNEARALLSTEEIVTREADEAGMSVAEYTSATQAGEADEEEAGYPDDERQPLNFDNL